MLALGRSHPAGVVTAQDDEFDDDTNAFEEDDEYTDDDDEEDYEYEEYEDYADSFCDDPKRDGRHKGDDWG